MLRRAGSLALAASVGALALTALFGGSLESPPETPMAHDARPVSTLAKLTVATRETCPWIEARPSELIRAVSYPVVAEDCLANRFELVAAKVQNDRPCPERVRLTYELGSRAVYLEQHRETQPTCCSGEHVAVDHVVGCVEHAADEELSLRWSHNNHSFHLHGEVGLDEGLDLASAIVRRF